MTVYSARTVLKDDSKERRDEGGEGDWGKCYWAGYWR